MNKTTFIDTLFDSSAVFVDWDNQEFLVRDLMDLAYKTRSNEVKFSDTDNQIRYFVELMSAVLGNGYLVRGKGDIKPTGVYSSYTSGSTGEPKLISQNIENFIAPSIAMASVENMNEGSTFLHYLPCSTNAVFSVGMLPVALSGGKAVFRKFNPYHVVKDINEFRPTHTTLPPGIYTPVSKTKEWQTVDLRSFEYVLSGSNFTAPGFFKDIESKGGRPVHGYGTTEMPAIMCAYSNETHLGKVWYPGAEWKEVDGELWARWNHMDWWASGDMIEVDDIHGPKIIGRKDNQFKFRDIKIVPEQYEQTAKQHVNVTDAMLRLDKHLVLYYEGSAQPGDIEDMLRKNNTILPKKIICVSQLPRNHLGKIARTGKVLL